MKKRNSARLSVLLCLLMAIMLPSCGSIRTHAGIDHEWGYDFDDYGHSHKHKKYKKHKKHHKPKHHSTTITMMMTMMIE